MTIIPVRLPLVVPEDVPTYDCNEIVHIEYVAGYAKFWFAGPIPISNGARMTAHRQVKTAILWPVSHMAGAIRQSQEALARFRLLTPDDLIGIPIGEA